jgi:hypothetical protein
MNNNNFITRYLCELLLAVCAIVSGFAQLKITLINWADNGDHDGESKV